MLYRGFESHPFRQFFYNMILLKSRKFAFLTILIFFIISKVALSEENVIKEEQENVELTKQRIDEIINDSISLEDEEYISPYGKLYKLGMLFQAGFGFSNLTTTHNQNSNINSFFFDANIGFGFILKYSDFFHPFVKFIWRMPAIASNNIHNYRNEDFTKQKIGMTFFYDFEIGNIFIVDSYIGGFLDCNGRTFRYYGKGKRCRSGRTIHSISTFAILGTYKHSEEENYVPLLTDQGLVAGFGTGYLIGFTHLGIELDLKYKCLIHTNGAIPENIGKINHMFSLDINFYGMLV